MNISLVKMREYMFGFDDHFVEVHFDSSSQLARITHLNCSVDGGVLRHC